ncbi:IclR family transcriptional regulator [Haloechinothrix salitolerans]|uniref:IclR family transcriptional regulator n=1 Tax=Haloechinothrix salitolerans TaxID=926830 RepID=A0ABW2C880_9PSEU
MADERGGDMVLDDTQAATRPTRQSAGVVSVLNALRILEAVSHQQPVGVSELSRHVDLPKSSVQRSLRTLESAGWLRMVDRSRWGLTAKALGIGLRASGEWDIRTVAQPVMRRLCAETNETVHLVLRDDDEGIVAAREDSSQTIRTYVALGTRAPLYATSSGIAIMSRLPEEETAAILDGDLKSFTDTTVTDPELLMGEVRRTAERGYAFNPSSWWRPHVAAVAAPILNGAGEPLAALVISIPDFRVTEEVAAAIGESVRAAATEVCSQLP